LELGIGLGLTNTEQLEHALLNLALVDTDRAAPDLDAVEHQVVGARAQARRLIEVTRRRREGMVRGIPPLLVGVPEEGRELDDPEDVVAIARDQLEAAR